MYLVDTILTGGSEAEVDLFRGFEVVNGIFIYHLRAFVVICIRHEFEMSTTRLVTGWKMLDIFQDFLVLWLTLGEIYHINIIGPIGIYRYEEK